MISFNTKDTTQLHAYFGSTPSIDGVLHPEEWSDAFAFDSTNWIAQFSPVTSHSDLFLQGFVKRDSKFIYFGFNVTDDIIYGYDIPPWLPDNNPFANEISPRGFPWFGDEMEILIAADVPTPDPSSNATGSYCSLALIIVVGNNSQWQMVANTYKSIRGVGHPGLLQGEPRQDPAAWQRYSDWIASGAQAGL